MQQIDLMNFKVFYCIFVKINIILFICIEFRKPLKNYDLVLFKYFRLIRFIDLIIKKFQSNVSHVIEVTACVCKVIFLNGNLYLDPISFVQPNVIKYLLYLSMFFNLLGDPEVQQNLAFLKCSFMQTFNLCVNFVIIFDNDKVCFYIKDLLTENRWLCFVNSCARVLLSGESTHVYMSLMVPC